jgi:hypothetical protein
VLFNGKLPFLSNQGAFSTSRLMGHFGVRNSRLRIMPGNIITAAVSMAVDIIDIYEKGTVAGAVYSHSIFVFHLRFLTTG